MNKRNHSEIDRVLNDCCSEWKQSRRQKKLLSTSKIWTCGLQFNYGKIHQLTHAKSIYTRGKAVDGVALAHIRIEQRLRFQEQPDSESSDGRSNSEGDSDDFDTLMVSNTKFDHGKVIGNIMGGDIPETCGTPQITTKGGGGRDARWANVGEISASTRLLSSKKKRCTRGDERRRSQRKLPRQDNLGTPNAITPIRSARTARGDLG